MKTTKPTVAVINRYFYPVTAGIETNLLEIYPYLKKHGWDVTVHVTTNTLGKKDILKKKELIKGVQVFRYKTSAFGFFPKINWESVDLVSIQNFTISPHIYVLLYAFFLKLKGKKTFALVLSTHGGFTPDWTTFPFMQRMVKLFFHKVLGRFLINTVVDGVRAVSSWEKNELEKAGIRSELITIIGNGIEKEAFIKQNGNVSAKTKRIVASYGKYILDIARIHKIKNLETTISALAYLPSDVRLVVLGQVEDSSYYDQLQKLVQNLGLQKRVIFAGTLHGFDKYFLISKSILFVHMARWEAYANVIIESMSQKKACIVSDIPALEPIIENGKNGMRVPLNDHRALAKTISFYLKERNQTKLMILGDTNYAFAERQSWKKISSDIEQYYFQRINFVKNSQIVPVSISTRAILFLSQRTSFFFVWKFLLHPQIHLHVR